MRSRWWFVALVLCALAAAVAGLTFLRSGTVLAAQDQKDLVSAQKVDYPLLVSATGVLEASKSVSIGPPQIQREHRFRLSRVVPEATRVTEGDFLMEFDGTDISRRLREETANFQRVQEEYQKKRSDSEIQLRELKLNLEQAKADLEKLENKMSAQAEFLSAIDVAKTKLQRDMARRKVELLEQKYAFTTESQRLDLQISRSNESHYRSRMDTLLDAMDSLTVTAPVSGVVIYKRDWNNQEKQVGSYVFMLDTVLEIPDLSTLRAKVMVDEVDAGKIQVGQQAQIVVDAIQGRVFPGKIQYISAILKQAAYDRPQRVIECFVEFDTSGVAQIRPGMSARAQIQVGKYSQAIVIPLGSIQERNGRSFVQVWQPQKKEFDWREIELVTNDGINAVVKSGLQADERIRLKPTA